jgi:hypothetical protein
LAAAEVAAAEACLTNRQVQTALSHFDHALKLGADPDQGLASRWAALMMLGQFERAWRETDRTEQARKRRAEDQTRLPLHLRRVWDGSPVAGRRVFVSCYHGLGDTLQFVRYATPLAFLARTVTVECQPALLELISTADGLDAVVPFGKTSEAGEVDVHLEMMELMYAFRSTLETIPNRVPYLRVPKVAVEANRATLVDLGFNEANINVGLVWSSGGWNCERDLELRRFVKLAAIPRVRLFSLQRGEATSQIAECCSDMQIPDFEACSSRTADTAAAILSLDLVISVDTMVAHLAGALGRPVWVLLPFAADWRWMCDRDTSPWYPTMKLFRQTQPGDWGKVVDAVYDELLRLAIRR